MAEPVKRQRTKKTEPTSQIEMLRTLSDVFSRAGLSLRSGLTFEGDRDVSKALGYASALSIDDYRRRYSRGGIAARIIDAYPESTWRNGIELIEDERADVSTEFEEAWKSLQQRLSVWQMFSRADIVAGLGRYSILLLGAPGKMDSPLPRGTSPDSLLYLGIYAEDEAKISKFVTDRTNPRYGLPEVYTVARRLDGDGNLSFGVHWSRVIHVTDRLLDNSVYAQPRLERAWDKLDDLDKITGGGSEAFWIRVNPGLFFNIDPEATLKDGEIDEMRTRAEAFVHGMTRTMAMRGAEMVTKSADVTDFANQAACIVSLIAGATGIPQRLLLGSERGELASGQDRKEWDTRINDRRSAISEPMIVRPFVERLIEYGYLPKPKKSWAVRWPESADLGQESRATVAQRLADVNSRARGVVILPSEIRDRILQLEPIEEGNKEAEEIKKRLDDEMSKKLATPSGPEDPANVSPETPSDTPTPS